MGTTIGKMLPGAVELNLASRHRVWNGNGLLAGGAGLAFAWVLYRNAWIGDDAYLTFRTIQNFLDGYGLRWNVIERVQAYTHPLWLLVLTALSKVTGELFYTTIVLSMLLSVAVVVVFCLWVGRGGVSSLAVVLVLLFSRAFVDYSTSGLENPLTHLLLVLFFATSTRLRHGVRKDRVMATLAGLGTLNRMDTILLFLPLLAWHLLAKGETETGGPVGKGRRARVVPGWRSPERLQRAMGALVLGFVPVVCWEVFSLFYYGFPFPNTYYAKTGTGIPAWELMEQGIYYFQNSVHQDPLTFATITAGVLLSVRSRERWQQAVSLGILAYLLYVLRIGGDFMSGRFLTAPLVAALVLVANADPPGSRWLSWLMLGAIFALGFASPNPPPLSGRYPPNDGWDAHGIADERAEYFLYTGLVNTHFSTHRPMHPWMRLGEQARKSGSRLLVKGSPGMSCFYAGPEVHCLDRDALGDPLLARIPALVTVNWRIGHFWRRIPRGYRETLETGENRLEDPNLHRYYDRLSLVVRGPLLSRERLLTIWKFNIGAYDPLMDAYVATLPEVTRPYMKEER